MEERLTVLNKTQTSQGMAAADTTELQSEPFSEQRSNFTLSMLHDFSS